MGRLYCWVLACNAFVEILFEMTRNFVTGSLQLLVSYVIIPANLAKRGLRNRENISVCRSYIKVNQPMAMLSCYEISQCCTLFLVLTSNRCISSSDNIPT